MTRQVLFTNLFALLIASTGCQLIADFKAEGTEAAGADAGGKTNKGGAPNQGGASNLGGAINQGGTSSLGGVGNTTKGGGSSGVANTSGGTANGTAGTANGDGGITSTSGGVTNGGAAQGTNGGAAVTSNGGSAGGGTVVPTSGGAAGTGNVTASGGKTQGGSGGVAQIAGSMSGGGVGGVAITGGKTNDAGASTGGIVAIAGGMSSGGGASGGVATGGAATGGSATGGSSHKFVGGPCVVTPAVAAEPTVVYAHGNDGNVYRGEYSATSTTSWAAVTGLNGSNMANNADLDCHIHGDGYPVHLVALEAPPLASVLHTSSTDGIAFSSMTRVYGITTMLRPSILGDSTPSSYRVAFVDIGGIVTDYGYTEGTTAPTSSKSPSPPIQKTLTSGVHFDASPAIRGISYFAYADDGTLASVSYSPYTTSSSPWSERYFPPPSGQLFQYSPAWCLTHQEGVTGVTVDQVIVAVAGNRLWMLKSWTTWVQLSDVAVVSTPDCAWSRNGEVLNVVALTTSGGVLHVHGSNGTFTSTEIGSY